MRKLFLFTAAAALGFAGSANATVYVYDIVLNVGGSGTASNSTALAEGLTSVISGGGDGDRESVLYYNPTCNGGGACGTGVGDSTGIDGASNISWFGTATFDTVASTIDIAGVAPGTNDVRSDELFIGGANSGAFNLAIENWVKTVSYTGANINDTGGLTTGDPANVAGFDTADSLTCTGSAATGTICAGIGSAPPAISFSWTNSDAGNANEAFGLPGGDATLLDWNQSVSAFPPAGVADDGAGASTLAITGVGTGFISGGGEFVSVSNTFDPVSMTSSLAEVNCVPLSLNCGQNTGDGFRVDGVAGSQISSGAYSIVGTLQVIPVPAAVWLFGSALGLLGWARRRAA